MARNIRNEVRKANTAYRRAAVRAQYGKADDAYRLERAARFQSRQIAAVLDGEAYGDA